MKKNEANRKKPVTKTGRAMHELMHSLQMLEALRVRIYCVNYFLNLKDVF